MDLFPLAPSLTVLDLARNMLPRLPRLVVGLLSSGVTSAKNDVFAPYKVEIGPKRSNNGPKQAEKGA